MSKVFFDELQIPKPNYNLNVGSGAHGKQTAMMVAGIEEVLFTEKPDFLILYGDTNSTLAGAIAASKLHVPIVHIEAGLRSFEKSMPEEINRIMCDHVSTLLFTPTSTGYKNLIREGFSDNKGQYTIDNPGIFHCGDVMYDNSLYFSEIAECSSSILSHLTLQGTSYILTTVHRDNNTDKLERLENIFHALLEIIKTTPIKVVLPLHPRTKSKIEQLSLNLQQEIKNNRELIIVEPVSFLDMIQLEKNAEIIITDSGGVQKEAYFFQKPCLVLRKETEWVEIINEGAGILVNADKDLIINSFQKLYNSKKTFPAIFGDGTAANFICEKLLGN